MINKIIKKRYIETCKLKQRSEILVNIFNILVYSGKANKNILNRYYNVNSVTIKNFNIGF